MDENEYLDNRVKDQIDWYDKRSSWHKKRFLWLKTSETLLALMIPFLAGYINSDSSGTYLKPTVGLIGVIVALLANIITLLKLQENWIEYRTVAESLKHEKFLYVTKAGPYKDSASFQVFVERFESYISKENTQWAAYIKPKSGEPAAGGAGNP